MLADVLTSFIDNLESLVFRRNPDSLDLLLRSRTPSNDKHMFNIDGLRCNIIDDGGRRLEPEEWVRRFRNLDAMVYVVSLPGYCQNVPGHPPMVASPALVRYYYKH